MITAVVLTKNEENNIKECLSGLNWCDEVLVLDDNSTDKTGEIADNCGAKIIKHSLNSDFASQRNFGLLHAQSDWVLFVDADERVSLELAEEIKEKIKDNTKIDGYFFKRIDYFEGKWLKHGEIGAIRILRLARKNLGKWERPVDEKWIIKGKTSVLNNPLLHYSHNNLDQFLKNINIRSGLNAEIFIKENRKLNIYEWLKPLVKFFYNYFLKMGFLDGIQGFIFAVLMSFHSFLVRGKIYLYFENKSGKNSGNILN